MEEKKASALAYPANSHASKSSLDGSVAAEKKTKPEITAVAHATAKKKNWFQRGVRKVFAEDFDDIKSYFVSEAIIPHVRNLIYEVVLSGIELTLFGSVNAKSRSKYGSRVGKVSYDTAYRTSYRAQNESRGRSSIDVDEIQFDSREEAMAVLDGMLDMIDAYEVASVMDLYTLAGLSTMPTDDKYGWANLGAAKIVRSRDGWLLKMPKPMPLD